MSERGSPPVWWHRRDLAGVPAGDDWFTSTELEVLRRLRVPKRRDDWRLGRLVAKELIGALGGVPWASVEIRAALDGASEPFLDGAALPWSVSISHRAGCGLAAASRLPTVVGADLEWVEPRRAELVEDWFSASEQATVAAAADRDRAIALHWAAKEAAAKVLREGLRLDVRDLEVQLGSGDGSTWSSLRVETPVGEIEGWSRVRDGSSPCSPAGHRARPRWVRDVRSDG